jgi:hypothetical protein
MVEFFSWLASILAITWARKQDVNEIISEPASREAYALKLVSQNARFNLYLARFGKILDWIFGDSGRMLLFLLMFALIYSSSVFLINLAFAKSNYVALGVDPIPAWKTKLLFVGIIIATAIAFGGARFLRRPSKYFKEKPSSRGLSKPRYRLRIRRKYLLGHFACVAYYTFAIHIVYGSYCLTAFSFAVAALAACTSTTRLHHQQQFDHFQLGTIAGAGLGGHGLLVALLFFTSTHAGWSIYGLIASATVLCAGLTAIALFHSKCEDHDVSDRGQWVFCSLVGRPALYVGFYCSRAAGSFCFSVATLLVVCYWMEQKGHFPREIIVPASVILTSAIFLAGATSIAGAGAFALLIMGLVTGFLILIDPSLLFQEWSYLVVFWFLFPILNASFDFLRWQIVRIGIRYRLRRDKLGRKRLNSSMLILADLAIGVTAITAFTYCSVFVINWYNILATTFKDKDGNFLPPNIIPVDRFLEAAHSDFWSNGIWLLLMVSTMLLPTLFNLAIFLAAGSIGAVPIRIRSGLAQELRTKYETDTALGKDWLAWRIAAVDSFAGLIFVIGVSAAAIYLTIWIAPAFAEFLYYCAHLALGTNPPSKGF